MKESKISGVIITYNEEDNIERCITSLHDIVDEIIVVDSFSTDKTKEICNRLGVIFIENIFLGHIEQKNFAISKAKYTYVLSLDADEALSDELKISIIEVKQNLKFDAYSFNRLTNYCNKWIRHCGWYPDKKIRLFDKNKSKWGGENPHDKIIMAKNSKIQDLKGSLLHYSYPTISSHLIQMEKFSSIAAREAFKKHEKMNIFLHLFLYPTFIFFKAYIFQKGFLDGFYGYVICKNAAYYRFLKYAKIYDLMRHKQGIKGS